MADSTAQLVREARRGRGLTQRGLAEKAGVTQSALAHIERAAHDTLAATLDRLIGAAGYQIILIPTTSSSASTWAERIYETLRTRTDAEEYAFRALISLSDQLGAADGPLRVALCVAGPARCGDERFDAAIAALVEHHLAKDGLPIPGWVHDPWRTLAEPWAVTPYIDASEVPPALLRHGVMLAASELASV